MLESTVCSTLVVSKYLIVVTLVSGGGAVGPNAPGGLRRGQGTRPRPEPIGGGSLDALRAFDPKRLFLGR